MVPLTWAATTMLDLPTDMVPTLITWLGIGILGAIGIVVAAQVSGTIQQEIGPLFGGR